MVRVLQGPKELAKTSMQAQRGDTGLAGCGVQLAKFPCGNERTQSEKRRALNAARALVKRSLLFLQPRLRRQTVSVTKVRIGQKFVAGFSSYLVTTTMVARALTARTLWFEMLLQYLGAWCIYSLAPIGPAFASCWRSKIVLNAWLFLHANGFADLSFLVRENGRTRRINLRYPTRLRTPRFDEQKPTQKI